MPSSIKDIQISNVGSTIEVLIINLVKPNVPECFSLSEVKSVIPTYNLGIGRSGINTPTTYPFTDQLLITIDFKNDSPSLIFDIQTVSNQAGWTADLPGLTQAIADICGWMSAATGGAGLATEITLAAVLALLTGSNLSLGTSEYTDAVNHNTTAGKNTVMITCTDSSGSINGVIRPAGIYTFQPTGDDKNAIIIVNANGGRIIVDEL